MHTASREWADRVAARNAVETAKALRYAGRGQIVDSRTQRLVSPRAAVAICNRLALSAAGKEAE